MTGRRVHRKGNLLKVLAAAALVTTWTLARAPAEEACQSSAAEENCVQPCEADQSLLDQAFSVTQPLKNVPLDFVPGLDLLDGSTLTFSGDLRLRLMDEADRLRPGGPGRSKYELWRWRNRLDFRAGQRFRLFVELLDASQFGEELPPTGIDVNRWNLQNYFVDVALLERNGRPITLRVGRQELDYGSTLQVSSLDWANTRRNFEGFRIISPGDVLDIDAFVTRPVNTATYLNPAAVGEPPLARYDNARDEPDDTRWFSGIYLTYKGIENNLFDLYWYWLETDNEFDAAWGAGSVGGDRHTLGLRWRTTQQLLDENGAAWSIWKLEVEGGFQFGKDNRTLADITARRDVWAGFFTTTATVTLPQAFWSPTVKFLYYWASGDDDPNDNHDGTFSSLFPFGHFYWGIIDNVTGQNLQDISLQFALKPLEKLTLATQLHWFDLDSRWDYLYNVAGVPLGTPNGTAEIGEELDLIATYPIHENLVVQLGYSWFWYGSYVESQPSLRRNDAKQFYLQTVLKY